MTRAETLSNIGTSKVMLSIIRGVSNPKAIADFLKIQPPPVIQQLRRLQKLGIVKLGTKQGKAQNYDIDWQRVAELFIERALQKQNKPGDIQIGVSDYTVNVEEIKSLKTNKVFQKFIVAYLMNFASDDPSRWITIADIINNINEVMPQMSTTFGSSKHFEDAEKQQFFDKMQLWYKKTTKAQSWMQLHAHDAILKVLKSEDTIHDNN